MAFVPGISVWHGRCAGVSSTGMPLVPSRQPSTPRREALAVLHTRTLTRNPLVSATPSPKPLRPLSAARDQPSASQPTAGDASAGLQLSPSILHSQSQVPAECEGGLLSECGSPAMEMLDAADTLERDMDRMGSGCPGIKAVCASVSAPSPAPLLPEDHVPCSISSAVRTATDNEQPVPITAKVNVLSSSGLLLKQMSGLFSPLLSPSKQSPGPQQQQQQQQLQKQNIFEEESEIRNSSRIVSTPDPGHMVARSLSVSPTSVKVYVHQSCISHPDTGDYPTAGCSDQNGLEPQPVDDGNLQSWLQTGRQKQTSPGLAPPGSDEGAPSSLGTQAASASRDNSHAHNSMAASDAPGLHDPQDGVSAMAGDQDTSVISHNSSAALGHQSQSLVQPAGNDSPISASFAPAPSDGQYQARSPTPLWQARLSEGLGQSTGPEKPMRLLHLDSRGGFDDANAVHYSLDFEEDLDDLSPSLGATSMRWASRFSEGKASSHLTVQLPILFTVCAHLILLAYLCELCCIASLPSRAAHTSGNELLCPFYVSSAAFSL